MKELKMQWDSVQISGMDQSDMTYNVNVFVAVVNLNS